MKPIIKQHRNNNRYVLTPSGLWVRDFRQAAAPVDINDFIDANERKPLYENEVANLALRMPEIGSDHLPAVPKILIVSDGFGFHEKKRIISQLPKDVCIIGTNASLAKWEVGDNGVVKRVMNYYFVNNPYPECSRFLPRHPYFPRCICSLRTNNAFLKRYRGLKYFYVPTPDQSYGRKRKGYHSLDDYRNPVCGAICFAAKCDVRRLAFLCCDDVFDKERAGSERLPNGMWMYPQHRTSHEIIDGLLYWLKSQEDVEVKIVNHSSGPDYKRAPYIELEGLMEFFK